MNSPTNKSLLGKEHFITEFKQNSVTLVGSKTICLLMSLSFKQFQTTDSALFVK